MNWMKVYVTLSCLCVDLCYSRENETLRNTLEAAKNLEKFSTNSSTTTTTITTIEYLLSLVQLVKQKIVTNFWFVRSVGNGLSWCLKWVFARKSYICILLYFTKRSELSECSSSRYASNRETKCTKIFVFYADMKIDNNFHKFISSCK